MARARFRMGMSRFKSRLARLSDARVYCVAGPRAQDEARLLRLAAGIQLTATPRAANVLLIAGELDSGLVTPALVTHDALPAPRATIWWRLGAEGALVAVNFPDALVVDEPDPVPALRRVHEELVSGRRRGEASLLPDVEPATWRGIGPYGQGGKAMTGGVPYGRPMPERADDRDGLKLDYLPVRIGPLFAPFPSGLALDVKLQGDVIQEARLENFADASTSGGSIFHRALTEHVAVRELELARARSHLQWLSDAVAVAGPRSLSERILRLAHRVAPGDGDDIRALERTLSRRGFLGWSTRGVGILKADVLRGVSGPVARASGIAIDARTEDPSYRLLGFEPVSHHAGDASARWIQRIREVAQALDLAERSGDERTGAAGITESPRGVLTEHGGPSPAVARLVPRLLAGMEWGDAVATVVSLDLDMSEAHALLNKTSSTS
jgi:hypothetical protein